MAMGTRAGDREQDLWVATTLLPRSPGHPFYVRLNQLLREAEFDRFVESLCEPYYAAWGRPSIPPGVYFRMLFVGYFEGIDSQRGISWRCKDSLSLREFLGALLSETTPDHSSLTNTRQRLPFEVHEKVFVFVLSIADDKGLLKGKSIAVDATMLEANAAMKSIVRRESGEDWKAYLKRLAQEEGADDDNDDDLRRFDKKRKKKKVSNKDWKSPTDPDAKIARMKDGTTHLAYKAEHAVDLGSELIVAAQILPATTSDPASLLPTLEKAQENLLEVSGQAIVEVVADRGYHKNETLADCREAGLRTYVCEPKLNADRTWTDKPEEWEVAYRANRRRVRAAHSKALQRQRSELAERGFAHVCETGRGRRSWIRGLVEVGKRYLIQVAGRNLGIIMRRLFGVGTPRGLAGASGLIFAAFFALRNAWECIRDAIAIMVCPSAPCDQPIGALGRQQG
jgi:transposase